MEAPATRGLLSCREKLFREEDRLQHRSWEHHVSESWLMARKVYLMASEIKGLVTDQRKLDEGKIEDVTKARQFVKLYGDKLSQEVDTLSRGPAARGHWMEAPAVKEFNAWAGTSFHLWDDALIHGDVLGFSPDAADIPQVPGVSIACEGDELVCQEGRCMAPREILEVKSYDSGNHFLRMSMVRNEEPLDERWQVAAAMAVCPSIQVARVLFFAPQSGSMFDVAYRRDSLYAEINTVRRIEKSWKKLRESFRSMGGEPLITEEQVYQGYLAMRMLEAI